MKRNIDLLIVVFALLASGLGCSSLKSEAQLANDKRLERIAKRSSMFDSNPNLLADYGKIPDREKLETETQFKGKVLILRKLPNQSRLSVFPFQYDFMDEFLANSPEEVGTVFLEILEDGSTVSEITASSKSPTGIKREKKKATNSYGWTIYAIDLTQNAVILKTFIPTHSTITTKTVDGKIKTSFSGGDELEDFYTKLFVK